MPLRRRRGQMGMAPVQPQPQRIRPTERAASGALVSSTYNSQILAAIPTYCPSCPPSLVTSLVNTESSGNQFTSSGAPLTSSAGAIGLFQLMPATGAGLSVNPNDPT